MCTDSFSYDRSYIVFSNVTLLMARQENAMLTVYRCIGAGYLNWQVYMKYKSLFGFPWRRLLLWSQRVSGFNIR